MNETRKESYRALMAALKNDRSSFDGVWRELSQWIKPNRARFQTSDTNRGDKRWQKIINAAGTFAARTLQAGMMASVTSPARPWFRLGIADKQLSEFGPAKDWLDDTKEAIRAELRRSNFYSVVQTVYGDMGVFGTGAMLIDEDDENGGIICHEFPPGSYYIANDHRNRVTVFAREFKMTVRQLMGFFGKKNAKGEYRDFSNFSPAVKEHWERGRKEQWVDVGHIITPNDRRNAKAIESHRSAPFVSCYYELGYAAGATNQGVQGDWFTANDTFLEEKGYNEFPVLAARWDKTAEDVYGTECPGMMALADIKMLQVMERRGLQGFEKMVNPPLVAGIGMKQAKISLLPGDISHVTDPDGKGLHSLHDTKIDLAAVVAFEQAVVDRIDKCFFSDLFLMIERLDRANVTATEIMERKQEKMTVLGPVLQQADNDLLDPLIDRVFAILNRQGKIPQPPQELEGIPLTVEYIGSMAQAQKEVDVGGLRSFASDIGNVVALTKDPGILDKWDQDQWVDELAERIGVPSRIIVPDEKVAEIRSERAKAQKAQEAAAAANDAASAAQKLAGSDTSGKNALTDLLGGLGQATPSDGALAA